MYQDFAKYYDELNKFADYKNRAEYVRKLFKKYDRLPTLLLDLCCGTGSFTKEMLDASIDTVGVDVSEEMLNIAMKKCEALFICQKAEELDLFGTVDGAICMLDSVNHITDKKNLKKVFKNVRLFLEKDRLFIFDINTKYKHENVLADNCFNYFLRDDFIAWTNCRNKKGTHIYIDIFSKVDSLYKRSSVDFFERVYSVEELSEMLNKSGFSVVAVHDDMTFSLPHDKSERLYIVARAK